MSVFKVNKNLPRQDQIDALNDMILELNGLIAKGKFDINEIDTLSSLLIHSRKFRRNVGIGNTVATHTSWTHVHAEAGYSIWKYAPTSYASNTLNNLYFNDRIVENRGLATSESSTTFDKVELEDNDTSGSPFSDHTTEAGTESGTEFELMDSTADYLYLGDTSATFAGAKFEFETKGSNYTLVLEYWDSSTWTTLTANTNNLVDGTSNFISNGRISWDIPGDWVTNTVDSTSAYWIRISTSTTPVTPAQAFLIIPSESVIGLLALSSTQFQEEDWAWCDFSGSVYVTIRNTGAAAFEGDAYIVSSSTSTNKENFFVHNNGYTSDYEDSTYNPVLEKTSSYSTVVEDGIIFADASSGSVTITLPTAVGNEGKEIVVKCTGLGSGATCTVDTESGETIDDSSTYTLSALNKFVRIVSDNTNWYIVGSN